MMFDPEIRDIEVPWPAMWEHKEPSARADVRRIQWAAARELAEQNVWRDRLESLRQLDLPTDGFDRMVEYDMDKLFAELEAVGAKYPPSSQDEKAWLENQGEEWDWSKGLMERRTARITDKDIRFEVIWLIELADHKERIKAFVLFAALLRVDPDSDDTYLAFSLWRALQICNQLHKTLGPLPSA